MSGFTLMGDAFALRVAATLLHFVWQGLVLALIAVLLNRLLCNASARARYSVNVGLLLAMVACLPLTFAIIDGAATDMSAREMAGTNFDVRTGFETRASEGSPFPGEPAESSVMPQDVADGNEKFASPPNGGTVRNENVD